MPPLQGALELLPPLITPFPVGFGQSEASVRILIPNMQQLAGVKLSLQAPVLGSLNPLIGESNRMNGGLIT